MNNTSVRISGIIHESLTNGPGMRRVIFAQGCKHNCQGCFNPHTHNFNEGLEMNIYDLAEDMSGNPLLTGVTFSGGDPFEQGEAFGNLAKIVRNKNFSVWCYTGYTFEEIIKGSEENKGWKELINNIDVLVDGKFIEEFKDENIKYRGSTNQRLIDVPKSLKENRVKEL